MNAKRLIVLGSSMTALAMARNAREVALTPVIVDTEAGIATRTSQAVVRLLTAEDDPLGEVLAFGGVAQSLIATSDHWVRFIADNEAALRSAFGQVLQSNGDALETCLDKAAFASWCRNWDIPTPDFCTAAQLRSTDPRELTYPMMMRPATTLHHQKMPSVPKAIEIGSPDELEQWTAVYRHAGIEPFLSASLLHHPLTQYSVGIARSGTDMVSLVARKLRPAPERCAVGTYVATCDAADVERLGREVATRLDLQGIAEIEILRDHEMEADFVVEVNPRPWLQYSLTRAAGHDFLRFLLGFEDNRERSSCGGPHYWLNFRGDLYNCFARDGGLVRNRTISLTAYLHSLLRTDACAYFSVHDPRPAWCEFNSILRLLARR